MICVVLIGPQGGTIYRQTKGEETLGYRLQEGGDRTVGKPPRRGSAAPMGQACTYAEDSRPHTHKAYTNILTETIAHLFFTYITSKIVGQWLPKLLVPRTSLPIYSNFGFFDQKVAAEW
jgi:hypothetical protein